MAYAAWAARRSGVRVAIDTIVRVGPAAQPSVADGVLDGVEVELALAGDDLLGYPVGPGGEGQVVAAQPGREHGELDGLLQVHAVAGQVEVQDGQQVQQLSFGQAGGLRPRSPCFPPRGRRAACTGSGKEEAGAGVPAGDEGVSRVGSPVGDDRQLHRVPRGGELVPGRGDLREDGRAAGPAWCGQVSAVDRGAAVDGVFDLLVAVRGPTAADDDVIEVAGVVHFDADADGGVAGAGGGIVQDGDARVPGHQPLVAVAGDASPAGARDWQRARHGACRNSGVGSVLAAAASRMSAVSGLSGKAVRMAAGISRWVRSE